MVENFVFLIIAAAPMIFELCTPVFCLMFIVTIPCLIRELVRWK